MRKPTGGKVGRPTFDQAKDAKKMRELLVREMKKRWKPIIGAQMDLAEGVVVQQKVKLPNGKIFEKYYQTKPDVAAARNLIEQSIGKPKESVEHSGSIRTITEVVAKLEAEDSE